MRPAAAIGASFIAGWLARSEITRRRASRERARTFRARMRTADEADPNSWLRHGLRRIRASMEPGSTATNITIQVLTPDGDCVAFGIEPGDEHPVMVVRTTLAGGEHVYVVADVPDSPEGIGDAG